VGIGAKLPNDAIDVLAANIADPTMVAMGQANGQLLFVVSTKWAMEIHFPVGVAPIRTENVG